jgi:hypothetical protein
MEMRKTAGTIDSIDCRAFIGVSAIITKRVRISPPRPLFLRHPGGDEVQGGCGLPFSSVNGIGTHAVVKSSIVIARKQK